MNTNMLLDQKILDELRKNSRKSNVEIAKKLKVSEGTVRKRIQRLIKRGVIKKFTIEISTKTGFSTMVLIKSKPQVNTSKIVENIKKIKDVESIFETAGDYDVIVNIVTISAESFNNIIERVRKIDGILETETLTILKIS